MCSNIDANKTSGRSTSRFNSHILLKSVNSNKDCQAHKCFVHVAAGVGPGRFEGGLIKLYDGPYYRWDITILSSLASAQG
ncbi:uncharacterized protein PpBr36_05684 [Pyricularia pennisetigena]|uniref:uncharacterized protein n=1 Tax=Pyricularia pennisetigena TaxID=1578925 RepID=UPI00114FCC5E|nr:uncharacterized protein PpBr36_05684 [Pyricularia pennisetigena]TLS23772.1 hypothetical protein PpBr36_05684 [Pyricularia pennisetigena]